MAKALSVPAAVMAAALLAGCGTPTATTYSPSDVGRAIQTARGTVVSSRPVEVTGETNPWGPGAGAALGAAGAYGAFGSGWTSVIGGVVGAGVGYAAQQALNTRSAFEYVLQMEDGRTLTIVQNRESSSEQALPPGTPVLVQTSGNYNRVLPDPGRGGSALAAPLPPPPTPLE